MHGIICQRAGGRLAAEYICPTFDNGDGVVSAGEWDAGDQRKVRGQGKCGVRDALDQGGSTLQEVLSRVKSSGYGGLHVGDVWCNCRVAVSSEVLYRVGKRGSQMCYRFQQGWDEEKGELWGIEGRNE